MVEKIVSTVYIVQEFAKTNQAQPNPRLAPSITWAASKQTYYTVRLLVDQERVLDAYRAYAYFRWVDDRLDKDELNRSERGAFVRRQQALIARCYQGNWPQHLLDEERLLVDLIQGDREAGSGLQSYIHHMMAVMAFDAERRGRLISEAELSQYTRWLAVAVTDAMHHFIGHRCGSPHADEARYLAATGAHITHMLRDTLEDTADGYYNIPREVIEAHNIDPCDVESGPYRAWVRDRVQLARDCFQAGRAYLARVKNPRCRLAGNAYIARFESVLEAIEREGYRLRAAYPECKSLGAGLRMAWSVLSQAFIQQRHANAVRALPAR